MMVTGTVVAGTKRGSPILQENKNDDQHQNSSLDKRAVNFLDRGLHEHSGIERNAIDKARREILGELIHLGAHPVSDVECIRGRQQVDADTCRGKIIQGEGLAIGLRPNSTRPIREFLFFFSIGTRSEIRLLLSPSLCRGLFGAVSRADIRVAVSVQATEPEYGTMMVSSQAFLRSQRPPKTAEGRLRKKRV